MSRNRISEDGRRRLREAAMRNRPWAQSTGPRTAAGKAASSRNAWKHGRYTRASKERRRELFGLLEGIREFRRELDGEMSDAELCELGRKLRGVADRCGVLESSPTPPRSP